MDVKIMDIDQVLNALGLAGALLIYLTPTMIIAITVYLVKRQKKLRKQREEVKEGTAEPQKPEKQTRESTKEIEKEIEKEIGKEIGKEIEDRQGKHEKKVRAESMALEFDEDGRIKK